MKLNSIFKGIIKTLVVLGFIMAVYNHTQWKDNIYNPDNREFVNEVLFNSDSTLTDRELQKAFDSRYLTD